MQKNGMSNKFLIDGFPRNQENLDGWAQYISKHANLVQVVYLDVSKEVMLERVLKRGVNSGRTDDNPQTFEKRYNVFKEHTMKIIDYFKSKNMVFQISTYGSVEKNYLKLKKGLVV
uniref:Adenylate kinase n=1 Tax=Euplotes crassus TaxID=5936 RepID=A0A7S3KHK3_EUPCR|mmetsp:Transcript_27775/g.27655  ORF Transcript_27775/g.27655 Transcript_27775/m.27655 type:complete len:116 (+) Transcript_27775:552-899(+)